MKHFLLPIILLCFLFGHAQQEKVDKSSHTFTSKVYKKERKIIVYLPDEYATGEQSYPVIYLFDGQFEALCDMVRGATDYMAAMRLVNDYIIVAVETENRPSEFTPMYTNKKTYDSWGGAKNNVGQAALLEQSLLEEIFPWVEKMYRTKPSRLGIGHSLGGTFVLQTMVSHPDMFKGIVAVSPNVSYDYEQLIFMFDGHLKQQKTQKQFLYVTAGTSGNMENNFRKSMIKLDSVIQKYKPKGLYYSFETFQGYGHSKTPVYSIPNGIEQFSGLLSISAEQKEVYLKNAVRFDTAIINHYSELSDWLGYEYNPNANELNSLGYDALNSEKKEAALGIFNWAIALHPKDANLYDSKGETLEKMGRAIDALAFYKKALAVLEAEKENYEEATYNYNRGIFEKNIERLDKI